MGIKSHISWTGDTWNPLYAVNRETGKRGWICVFRGPDCINCYAHSLNMTERGNGLPYHRDSLDKVELRLSNEGQTSIDWPLRSDKNRTIFLGSMTDWMAEFYPQNWQTLLLGVMSLATQHTFITLTKRWENLIGMLKTLSEMRNRAIAVPADRPFINAIARANRNASKYDLSNNVHIFAQEGLSKHEPAKQMTAWTQYAPVPWPPRNVIFGVSAGNIEAAKEVSKFLQFARAHFPTIKLAISQEPAYDIIDWKEIGLPAGTVNMIMWGGESGDPARVRPAFIEDWHNLKAYGEETGTPIWFKQTGVKLARQLGLTSTNGDDLNEATLRSTLEPVQQFADMTGAIV